MHDCTTECGVRLACAKYAVYGVDYEGHGQSEGVRCYIKKFNNIVNDCYDFFKSVSGMDSKPLSNPLSVYIFNQFYYFHHSFSC